jgi:alpha-galactosidase
MACNIPRIFQVNILNSNYFVPGIPQDFAVEIPALVSKAGVQGVKTYGLPKPLTVYALRDRVSPVNMEIEAYESGSRDLLLQLILMDPWARSEEQAKKFLEDILALPYHAEMREHYR